MSSSIERVEQAARDSGLEIEVKRMGASTRTAEEAAVQCGCTVGQIVKSLVFEGERSRKLYLFLVSGAHQLDPEKAAAPPVRRRPISRGDKTGGCGAKGLNCRRFR